MTDYLPIVIASEKRAQKVAQIKEIINAIGCTIGVLVILAMLMVIAVAFQ